MTPSVLFIVRDFTDDRRTNGGMIRRHHLIRAAQRVGRIEILVTKPAGEGQVERMNAAYGVTLHTLPQSPPSKRSRYAEAGPRLLGWASPHPEHVELTRWLRKSAGRYSVVMIECLEHLLPVIDLVDVPIVVDMDDIDSVVTQQRRQVAREKTLDVTSSRRLLMLPDRLRTTVIRLRRLPKLIREDVGFALESFRQRRAERVAVSRAAAVLVCSKPDREALGQPANAVLVPNGVSMETASRSTPALDGHARIAFWGGMTYVPNADGARWLRRFVIPELEVLDVRAHVVVLGYGCETLALEPHPMVEVLGFAQDLDAALLDVAVAVVPVRVGGGTRIKILEAWARGIPVVSTAMGAYGLEARDGRDILIADDPVSFARGVADLLEDEGLRERLIAGGLERARGMSWDVAEVAVVGALRRLLTAVEAPDAQVDRT